MGFFGGFKKFGKGVGKGVKAALPLLSVVAPMAGPGIGLAVKVATSILAAEKQFPDQGSGAAKAQYVRDCIARDLPALLHAAEAARGKEFVDEEAITKALNDMLDAQFRILNLTGLVNKEKKNVI